MTRWAAVLLAICFAPRQGAQSPPPPKFEVAAIKPCKNSTDGAGGGRKGPGSPASASLNLNCQTVKSLIQTAYSAYANGHINPPPLPPIERGPSWIESETYTISAKADATASPGMMRGPMLQALLEDRFQLKIRRENREVPAYALTVAKGGARLKPFQPGSCVDIGVVSPLTTAPPPPPAPGERPYICGVNHGRSTAQNVTLDIRGISLDFFAKTFLVIAMERPVFNRTGLTGLYDIQLEFGIDETARGSAVRAGTPGSGSPAASESAGASILTALQQQLGLRLEATRGPAEFLVIDRVERPSQN